MAAEERNSASYVKVPVKSLEQMMLWFRGRKRRNALLIWTKVCPLKCKGQQKLKIVWMRSNEKSSD